MRARTERTPVRLLFVEDSEADVKLALRVLERAGFDVRHDRVDSEDTLRSALSSSVPEIILSDFSMPCFNGERALRIVRELAPEVPFIFVSGAIGEERAIEAFHDGAIDYVLKGNLRRLETAVRRALALSIERKRMRAAQNRIEHLANYDRLTGLPNRILFTDRCEQAITHAHRTGGCCALLVMEVEGFALVAESYGHQAGDDLLCLLAERLLGIIPDGGTLARLGDNTFAILAADLGRAQDAAQVAQKILDATAMPLEFDTHEVFVTASIGLATYPHDSDDAFMLIKNADAAMYGAKQLGKNNYQFYTAEMNKRALEQLQLENDLRRALKRDEFVLHFQPKASLTTGEITGVEALLRWNHPDGRLVPPSEFIPQLEESGLIVPVGEWILRSACMQVQAWRQAGVTPVSIAVNLSASQFQQHDLCAIVGSTLREYGVDPRLLELEITETAAMQNAKETIATLRGLKALGVRLSIDDFGTGYSSLSYLKSFPVDTLKIDRTFIGDLAANPDDASIAQAIINMAHSLHLKVVAEGVESESQLSFLSSQGCDQMQGYYFAHPLAAPEITAMLAENRKLQRPPGPSDNGQRTLLLLDDEENILSALKRLLRQDNYEIFTATTPQAAFEILANHKVGVIVSDQRMPEGTGVEFLCRVKELYPDPVRIVLSGYTDLNSVTEAINQGAIYRFLTKPWEDSLLRANIAEAFRRYQVSHENRRLQQQLSATAAELSRTNDLLQTLLAEQSQIAQGAGASLRVVQEAFEHIPVPLIGIDSDGMIVLANASAEEHFGERAGPFLGCDADERLPSALRDCLADPGQPTRRRMEYGGTRFDVLCRRMGPQSDSDGALLVALPLNEPAALARNCALPSRGGNNSNAIKESIA